MAGFEVNVASTVCRRCGTAYSRTKGYFPVSYAALYKGTGHLPYCKDCVDAMFYEYTETGHSQKDATRQMCRKLDLYWKESLYDQVDKLSTAKTIITKYIAKTNQSTYAGRCYDDTLKEDGSLWCFSDAPSDIQVARNVCASTEGSEEDDIPDEYIQFWGAGYSSDFYNELEKYYEEWTGGKEISDPAERALYKQICLQQATITRDTAAGKSTDKSVNTLNTLIGSLNLKPVQKKDDDAVDNTPFGVWIRRWENERPIPEVDPELKDVDGIVKYISIWFLGHLCKMLGIKNTYCKLYEDKINEMRIDRPEYEEDDDEELFNKIFSDDNGGDND